MVLRLNKNLKVWLCYTVSVKQTTWLIDWFLSLSFLAFKIPQDHDEQKADDVEYFMMFYYRDKFTGTPPLDPARLNIFKTVKEITGEYSSVWLNTFYLHSFICLLTTK